MTSSDRHIESPLVWEFYRYWHALADGAVPHRDQFDPTAVPRLVPSLHIVELERATDRLRYRLVGTRSDALAGSNLTGRYLDEFFRGETAAAARFFDLLYRRIAQSGQPEMGEYAWPTPTGTLIHIVFGVFPFRAASPEHQFFYLEDLGDIYSDRRRLPWWSAPISDPSRPQD